MSLESWNTFFQFGSAVLLALTFAFGAGAIWTSYVLGQRQAAEIARIDKQAAEANENAARLSERAALAELKLAEIQRRQGPRWINHLEVTAALKGKETGTASITYVPDEHGESYALATQFWAALTNAGWKIVPIGPVPATERKDVDSVAFHAVNRVDAPTLRIGDKPPDGVVLMMVSLDADGPPRVLRDALRRSGIGIALGADTDLGAHSVRIVVGIKP